MKHKIDTNRDIKPLLPSWAKEVVENKTYGEMEYNPKDTELYLSEKQKNGDISGHDLREEMKDKNPVNLAYLQFFEDNPKLFPKDWKGKYIYGWGTIVRHNDGSLSVPGLLVDGGEVILDWFSLDYDRRSNHPALRFKSANFTN